MSHPSPARGATRHTVRAVICTAGLLALGLSGLSASPAAAKSAPAEDSGYVETDGARLHYRIVGEGPAIIVVHGGPGLGHGYLAPQLIRLLAEDYRLVFYDQRASGRSTGTRDAAKLNLPQFVDDLEAVRRALGLGRISLLGHSFGGFFAMQYAFTHPDPVERLLLVDSVAASWELTFPPLQDAIDGRRTDAERDLMQALQERHDLLTDPAAMARYLRVFFRPYFHDPARSEELALDLDELWLANFNASGGAVTDNIGRYDFHARLGEITAPTLVLHGDASVIPLAAARAIHDEIPDSQLVVLQEVGHFPYIEHPQAFQAAVRAFMSQGQAESRGP